MCGFGKKAYNYPHSSPETFIRRKKKKMIPSFLLGTQNGPPIADSDRRRLLSPHFSSFKP
jgi:hypothetical protein